MTRDTAERARELAERCRAAIFGPGILANGDPGQQRVFDVERMEISLTPMLTQLQAEARERLAAWMVERSFSTGHGDTFEDLLKELDWQVKELRGARLEEAKWWHENFPSDGMNVEGHAKAYIRIAALAQALQLGEKEKASE